LLAVPPAFGQERRADPPISLYTSFQQAAPPAVVEELRNEVASLLEPADMHLEWRALSSVTGSEVSSELAVVKFLGRCDVDGLMAKNTNPGALGWTHVSDGVILPFADVDCDRIRSFVQKDLMFVPAAEREFVFARAVARVLAHELYHIFTQTAHHASDGVGKSAFTVQELLGDGFQFQGKEADLLRTIAQRVNPSERTTATPAGPPPL
jgi:hypothetical protein